MIRRAKKDMEYDWGECDYQKLFWMLLETIPSSVLLLDRQLNIVMTNRNFLEKNMRTTSNTIGHNLADVFPEVILRNLNIVKQIRQVFRNNQATRGQLMSYRAPGLRSRTYYYRIVPYCQKGIVENAIFLMDDVTEKILLNEEVGLAQRHLESVVESASDMVVSFDTERKILTWNLSAERIFGYTFEEVKGTDFSEYFAVNCRRDLIGAFANIMTGMKSHRAEWNLTTKQGVTINASWDCSPMRDNTMNTIGIVAVGRDLSERRQLELELFQSQKFAALGVMAGGIAHEIRNPLAICSSSAQFLLEEEVDSEFRKECASKIYTGIKRASVIIENLLKFARPSMNVDMAQIDLFMLLQETVALIANQAKIKKISIVAERIETSIMISGISSLMQQVFMNLLLNAIDSMPEGGTISLAIKKEHSVVSVSISDTGVGIAESEIDKIFDPFYTTASPGTGTGLGLALTYAIAKQHDGIIDVESESGKGSTFTVRLPIRRGY